ncbi:MAG TPA: hypothetical protein PK043_00640 [Alicycliphilus sp.]|nr:hypothetical protein [Alicycliphilus sp.]HRP20070.1 hypothetical protein [Alicycliphilus sp.]
MASTPIARSKTAALARILDSIPKGYTRYTFGQVPVEKAHKLLEKLHERHGIGCTPAQRIARKSRGRANVILVTYWPSGEVTTQVHWLMLFTEGELAASEHLREVTDKPRLAWLGYELVRHTARSRESWTFRRPKEEMAEHHAVIAELSNKRLTEQLASYLQSIANQPGFHGVRAQTWSLCQEALRRGCPRERLPYVYFLSKVSHGERLELAQRSS